MSEFEKSQHEMSQHRMSPMELQQLWFRHYVLALLAERGDPAQADSDGDIAIFGNTAWGWLRVEGDPVRLHIFAIAASAVKMSKAALAEVNDINAREALVKVVLCEGAVIVRLQVPAEAVTAESLDASVRQVLDVADGIGPLLRAVHGHAPVSPAPSHGR